MRYAIILAAFVAGVSFVGCAGAEQTSPAIGNTNAARGTTTPTGGATSIAGGDTNSPAASTHRGGAKVLENIMAEKPSLATPELDAKIEKAESKAKASGASETDKLAAAAVYVERANIYRDAGQPVLYKFALGDYRRALRYQPSNEEARAKMDEIVGIYNSMGRPVPTNGNEP